jgi:hypothetical protein
MNTDLKIGPTREPNYTQFINNTGVNIILCLSGKCAAIFVIELLSNTKDTTRTQSSPRCDAG